MNSEIFHLPLTDMTPLDSKEAFNPAPILPKSYGQNRLMALPRDPNCLWLYWELKNYSGEAEIRLYFAENQRLAAKASCRIESTSHYLQVSESGASYYAELGTWDSKRQWHSIVLSNVVTLPYGYPADQIASGSQVRHGAVSSGMSSQMKPAIYSRRSS